MDMKEKIIFLFKEVVKNHGKDTYPYSIRGKLKEIYYNFKTKTYCLFCHTQISNKGYFYNRCLLDKNNLCTGTCFFRLRRK